MEERHLDILRRHMVELIEIYAEVSHDQLGKDALDARVMAAMGRIPRHMFVPPDLAAYAYENTPLPIGFDKTISQPFIVAVMTDLLDPREDSMVLEIGTGLGYQAAVLSALVRQVYSIEIVEELAVGAQARLRRQGYANVEVRLGDGSKGWPEHAPYDRILVAASAERVPEALTAQLKPGGRMVLPIGPPEAQALTLVEKDAEGDARARRLMPVRFTMLETVR